MNAKQKFIILGTTLLLYNPPVERLRDLYQI